MKEKVNVLVGVCGGIAAYKSCELVRFLVKNNYNARVVMTPAAERFVTPLTFQTLSGSCVYRDMYQNIADDAIKHISLGCWADICVIAPASANTISKIASGICDNLLTSIIVAMPRDKSIILAPAMNVNMWQNPIIQSNITKLRQLDNYIVLDTANGDLACGTAGEGRMLEAREIFEIVKSKF